MGKAEGEGPHLPPINPLNPAELKQLLQAEGFAPTKRLGQHFLISERVVGQIMAAVGHETGSILEVGPGPGALTHLLSRHWPVSALEVDERAVRVLAKTAPQAQVIHADALQVDLPALVHDMPQPLVLVSNMPYHITGPLLTAFTRIRQFTSRQILMMQREVAQKITALSGDGELGSISVFLQSRFNIRTLCLAHAGAFWPPPKVDSTVLIFEPRPLFAREEEHEVLVRRAFVQPRKTLANNLVAAGYPRDRVLSALERVDLGDRVRPHEVPLMDWHRLLESLDDA